MLKPHDVCNRTLRKDKCWFDMVFGIALEQRLFLCVAQRVAAIDIDKQKNGNYD